MWSEGAWRLQDHEERGIELGGGLDPLDLGPDALVCATAHTVTR